MQRGGRSTNSKESQQWAICLQASDRGGGTGAGREYERGRDATRQAGSRAGKGDRGTDGSAGLGSCEDGMIAGHAVGHTGASMQVQACKVQAGACRRTCTQARLIAGQGQSCRPSPAAHQRKATLMEITPQCMQPIQASGTADKAE
eukprot:356191-Chlamydomonas_euryale.AAC.5